MTDPDDRTVLTRHANELPEHLESAIGTGWIDRDEDVPDYDALLADAAATIRQLAPLAAELAAARTVTRRLLDGWEPEEHGGDVWIRIWYSHAGDPPQQEGEPMTDAARAWLAGFTEPTEIST